MKPIYIYFSGYGHFRIFATYRGKQYSTVTTNTLAIDRYRDTDVPAKAKRDGWLTHKQAVNCLYNEIKRANNLM